MGLKDVWGKLKAFMGTNDMVEGFKGIIIPSNAGGPIVDKADAWLTKTFTC